MQALYDRMDEQVRTANVRREKMYGLKTRLVAVDTIPPNTFLFYNFSEMIHLAKDVEQGYRSTLEQKFSMFGAGKTFLLSLEPSGTVPTYDEAINDSKWDFRFINMSNRIITTGLRFQKTRKKSNVELREGFE